MRAGVGLMVLLAGCPWISDPVHDLPEDTDTDTVGVPDPDTDTDWDTDTEADTDADTEADTDADTEADTDADTEPPPIDMGTVTSSTALEFGQTAVSLSRTLTLSQPVSGGWVTSPFASISASVQIVAGGAILTLTADGHDWRADNPVVLDVTLQLGTGTSAQTATGQWEVSALPSEVAVSTDGSELFLLMPPALALPASNALLAGGTAYGGVDEVSPGLWSLGALSGSAIGTPTELCVTAGTGGEACLDGYARTFNGSVSRHFRAVRDDGAAGTLAAVAPYDWDQDDALTSDDLLSYMEGPPCRTLEPLTWRSVELVAPSDDVLDRPFALPLTMADAFGAPVSTVSVESAVYEPLAGEGPLGEYGPTSPVDAAVWLTGTDVTVEEPGSSHAFRVTNPSTHQLILTGMDDGGRCYVREALWTVAAVPTPVALMWIDDEGYLASGAAVAPRSGSVHFADISGSLSPIDEVMRGVWALTPTPMPDPTTLELVYFSQGARYATSMNEAYLNSFTPIDTVLVGGVGGLSGVEAEVYFPDAQDYDGDSAITPADLRFYLDGLE